MARTSGIRELAQSIIEKGARAGKMVATAESCTGGMIGAALTDIPGSSVVFDRGFITYSNDAKIDMLGVAPATIEKHGAVSKETALAMAEGALAHSRADIAVSVTGVAGPDGGTPEKPVGLVWFALALKGAAPRAERHNFAGERDAVRSRATEMALTLLLRAL